MWLSRVYKLRGRFAEAEPLLREAIALRIGTRGASAVDIAGSRYELADLLGEMDRYAEAGPLFDGVAAVYRSAYGPDEARVAVVDIDRALARRAGGELDSAQSLLDHAVRSLRADPVAPPTDLATALLYAGKVRLERGDLAAARAPLEEALRIRRGLFGEVHPMVANALDGLGESMIAGGYPAAAEDRFRAALAIRREILPDGHSDIGVALLNVAIALHGQGREEEAEAALAEALPILRGAFGDGNPLVATAVAYADSVAVNRRGR
jgi:tetratricopeptide (TPR) repeat protein